MNSGPQSPSLPLFREHRLEAPHPSIGLGPDAQIFEHSISLFGGIEHFAHMSPIHADEMDRAVGTEGAKVLERRRQEFRELASAHFPRSHREFSVFSLPRTPLNERVDAFAQLYNRYRPHGALGGQTPRSCAAAGRP